jgi:sulfur carrier protein
VTQATVNGEVRELPTGTTLDAVVRGLTARSSGVAAAVNGAVVPRGQWASTALDDGDEVEVLTAAQGG